MINAGAQILPGIFYRVVQLICFSPQFFPLCSDKKKTFKFKQEANYILLSSCSPFNYYSAYLSQSFQPTLGKNLCFFTFFLCKLIWLIHFVPHHQFWLSIDFVSGIWKTWKHESLKLSLSDPVWLYSRFRDSSFWYVQALHYGVSLNNLSMLLSIMSSSH